tara:strand:+ start:427 stop:1203 length:777 start_codon:yes stop_codon:yes gene_type:complete
VNKDNHNKKIGVLDWLIFFSIIMMFVMVYVPQSIWAEEDKYKKIRREQMEIISQAEEFYYEVTGKYTIDHKELFSVLESAVDSLIADSLFIGRQSIKLNNKIYDVALNPGYHIVVDTTFSKLEKLKIEVEDTLYSIKVKNRQGGTDSIVVNSHTINKYKKDSTLIEIYDTISQSRIETQSNYMRRKFHLNESLIYCPISLSNQNKKFILELVNGSNGQQQFKISSPLDAEDVEKRYLIFKYNPGKGEYILNGQKSWAG